MDAFSVGNLALSTLSSIDHVSLVVQYLRYMYSTSYNYLCTYDLYSPVLNVLDACISITRRSDRGLGPRIQESVGPCEMASSR
jgi:hypothetical protein